MAIRQLRKFSITCDLNSHEQCLAPKDRPLILEEFNKDEAMNKLRVDNWEIIYSYGKYGDIYCPICDAYEKDLEEVLRK